MRQATGPSAGERRSRRSVTLETSAACSRVGELSEHEGSELLYLPSYSPGLDAIKESFPKIKCFLPKAGARTLEALVETMGK